MNVFRAVVFIAVVGVGSVLVRNTTDMLKCLAQGVACVEAPRPSMR